MDANRPDQPESDVYPLPTARAVTLDELYVQAGETPSVRQVEESWLSSGATVLMAITVAFAVLTLVGYPIW